MDWENDQTPRKTINPGNPKSSELAGQAGVLGGQHMGGHSDVGGKMPETINYSVKTKPLVKK